LGQIHIIRSNAIKVIDTPHLVRGTPKIWSPNLKQIKLLIPPDHGLSLDWQVVVASFPQPTITPQTFQPSGSPPKLGRSCPQLPFLPLRKPRVEPNRPPKATTQPPRRINCAFSPFSSSPRCYCSTPVLGLQQMRTLSSRQPRCEQNRGTIPTKRLPQPPETITLAS